MKKLIENLRALFAAVSEDMRKIGIFLIGAGQLGILVDNDKMTGWAGVLVMAVGIIAWAFFIVPLPYIYPFFVLY